MLGSSPSATILTEDPDTGVGLRNEWDGSRRSGRLGDRLSVWLRLRDVRSGDAARRPREMRLSCQLKGVGCGGDLDSLYLVTEVFCSGDNNKNNKPNATEVRLIEDDNVVRALTTDLSQRSFRHPDFTTANAARSGPPQFPSLRHDFGG
jgi:hypothetical protein